MLFHFYSSFKSYFLDSGLRSRIEEFERLESRHTRIRFDYDIYEVIRVC